jgi:hypothetical protein
MITMFLSGNLVDLLPLDEEAARGNFFPQKGWGGIQLSRNKCERV